MQKAIAEATKTKTDVPVGAIITLDGEIISQAHNLKEDLNDVTAHAEIVAIREAQEKLKTWHLDNCELYVTLEPCPMCSWAILQSRIKTLYFGSYDSQYGGFSTKLDLKKVANSNIKIYGGIDETECDKLLEEFFTKIREQKSW